MKYYIIYTAKVNNVVNEYHLINDRFPCKNHPFIGGKFNDRIILNLITARYLKSNLRLYQKKYPQIIKLKIYENSDNI